MIDEIMLNAAGLSAAPGAWQDDATLRQLAGVLEAARRTVTEFDAEATKLRASGSFTPSGLDNRLSELAGDSLERLDRGAVAVIAKAEKELQELRVKLARVPGDTTDAAARAIREALILAELMKLPDLEAWSIVAEAGVTGEADVVRAALGAPTFLRRRFAPDARIDELRDALAESADPVAAGRAKNLERALATARGAVSAAKRMIADTQGLSPAAKTTLRDKLGLGIQAVAT